MRREWLARIIVIILVVVAMAVPIGTWWVRSQGIVIHARMAETGGWTPDNLTAEVGKPLHLRLTSDDVMHSFAIGKSDKPPVDVIPGETTEVTLTFDRPGKYVYYCTRWCSVNHWRMRGVIEVTAPQGHDYPQATVEPPLFVRLGLDIDAQHTANIVPHKKPSALRGAMIDQEVPSAYLEREYYLTHSPLDVWKALRGERSLAHLPDQIIWDLAAEIWKKNITTEELIEGQKLYTQNCAACHGAQGRGNGVFANKLAQPTSGENTDMRQGEMTTRPADFTDALHMLAASPAHLQGKIIRGGMGTGMPYWGPIFTEHQIWALVAYLWTFQFNMEDQQ